MDWIERIFGLSPDGGSGSLELAIAIALVAAVVFTVTGILGLWRKSDGRRRKR